MYLLFYLLFHYLPHCNGYIVMVKMYFSSHPLHLQCLITAPGIEWVACTKLNTWMIEWVKVTLFFIINFSFTMSRNKVASKLILPLVENHIVLHIFSTTNWENTFPDQKTLKGKGFFLQGSLISILKTPGNCSYVLLNFQSTLCTPLFQYLLYIFLTFGLCLSSCLYYECSKSKSCLFVFDPAARRALNK